MSDGVRIAVIGLGEAGLEIARDLVAAGADVRAHAPVVAAPAGAQDRSSDLDAVRDAREQLVDLGVEPRVATAARDLLRGLSHGVSRNKGSSRSVLAVQPANRDSC